MLSLGPADAVEQLRGALGVGCPGGGADRGRSGRATGPPTSPREIAAVVKAHEAEGKTYDLILLGNDAADTGDFQVGIRLAYELGRPVVNGVRTVEVDGGVATARGDGIDGVETYEVPLPAVVTVLEGGVEPRYPTITGRMKAKKTPIETVAPRHEPRGPARVRLTLAARPAQHGRRARRGPRRRGRGGRPAAAPWGGPMILVFVETDAGRRHRGLAGDRDVRALARRARGSSWRAGARGRRRRAAREARRRARRVRRRRGAPRHGRRVLGLRRGRVGRGRAAVAAATAADRRARARHPAGHGGARAPRRAARRGDGGQRRRHRATDAARRHPAGAGRRGAGGDAAARAARRAHGRRARRRGHPGRDAGRCRGARALPRGGRGRPAGQGRVHRARGPGRVRRAHLGPGRGRRGSRSRAAPTGSTA